MNDFRRIGNVETLDGSPFEKLNVRIKRGHQVTSQQQASGAMETVVLIEVMDATREERLLMLFEQYTTGRSLTSVK